MLVYRAIPEEEEREARKIRTARYPKYLAINTVYADAYAEADLIRFEDPGGAAAIRAAADTARTDARARVKAE